MLLKKRVKAGILLYALLMLAIFSLLLQFYLTYQRAEAHLLVANRQTTQAYLMAHMTKQQVEKEVTDIIREETERQQQERLLTEKLEPEGKELEEKSGQAPPQEQAEREKQVRQATNSSQTETVSLANLSLKGELSFDKGRSRYQVKGRQLSISVELDDAASYRYEFFLSSMGS